MAFVGPRLARSVALRVLLQSTRMTESHSFTQNMARDRSCGHASAIGDKLRPTTSCERRSRPRLPLRCSLSLYRPGSARPIDGETLNISSEGFYCFVPVPFSLGENLSCILSVPSESPPYAVEGTKLKCDVEVVRVDSGGPTFGVAFRVHNFTSIRG